MKVVSVFSGVGGFDLAAEQVGMEVVACIERDPHCRKLLAARFPKAQLFDDVCTVGAHNLPACEIIVGGWPCQDLSVAGKRAGIVEGERSNLFYELTRLIRELKPRYFLGENVPGLFSSDGGGDFARVLGELAKCGKADIAWRTLDSQWFGVPQRRRRVFIVADFGGERASEILALSESLRRHPAPSRETGKEVAGTLGGSSQSGGFRTADLDNSGAFIVSRDVAPTLNAHFGTKQGLENQHIDGGGGLFIAFHPTQDPISSADGSTHALGCGSTGGQASVAIAFQPGNLCRQAGADPTEDAFPTLGATTQGDQAPHVATKSQVRRLSPTETLRLQAFPDDWLDGLGLSDSTKYKMTGNAVTVSTVRWILNRIANPSP